MKEQLHTILKKLIVKNNIRVNKEELQLQLSSHPSYPSLHALTGVLDHFNIPNLALRVSVNSEMLKKLPPYFIANLVVDTVEDLVLVEKKKGKIKITTTANHTELVKEEEFLSRWNGIILAIEKSHHIKEVEKSWYDNAIFNWISSVIVGLCITYFLVVQADFFAQVHFILSCVGLIISVFVVKHELGLQSSATNQFCNLTEKTSCDAVLRSKGSTIFKIFKLSDISLTVFAIYCLSWILFFIGEANGSAIISMFTVLAIPFSLYSLYYQYSVIKKWCPLCLGIVAVLMFQFGTLIVNDFFTLISAFSNKGILLFILSIVTTISIWNVLKSLIKKKESFQKTTVDHYTFKRKFSIFKSLYEESDTLLESNHFSEELVFGNKNATVELVLVTSPLCFFCKKAHSDIEYLLDKLKNKIKVIIRFNVDITNKDALLYRLATRLHTIYNIEGEHNALKALHEVYQEDINLQKWLDNQNTENIRSFDRLLSNQHQWCQINAINFTPALYQNNMLFPQEYDRTDLIYFIDDFIASMQVQSVALVS
ncbi:vitamin K epoxide reductase family protein [Aquimarina litoralis]|uniref:vitamin K epoxide reductase family protein n=1 Tax=Aquimarina litoralis TaxID=584605 RepID=UPI001C5837A8|nr:vitamin K epoxide reductase family protein [Aquimarina litoralis]MBW1294667.1 thioredoxin domain-containing protein [Aquimarina litoralis]